MEVSQTNRANWGYAAIVVASILFGTIGILAKMAFQYSVSPATLIALRLSVSSLTLLVILASFRRSCLRISRADVGLFILFGLFAVAFQRISYFYAIDLTTATFAAMLFYTYPVFVILSVTLLQKKERISASQVFAIALTFFGVTLVVRAYDFSQLKLNFWGIIFGILSGVSFAVYYLMTSKLRGNYSNLTVTLFGDGIAALALLPIIIDSASQVSGFPAQLWLIILAIGWIPSLLAYALFSYGLKYVKASRGTMLSVLEPIATAFFSAVIIGETFENLQIVGAILSLTGVVLLFRSRASFPANRD